MAAAPQPSLDGARRGFTIKHDPELVQALVPLLYKAGVYDLGIEFANYSDQALIDKLINAQRIKGSHGAERHATQC